MRWGNMKESSLCPLTRKSTVGLFQMNALYICAILECLHKHFLSYMFFFVADKTKKQKHVYKQAVLSQNCLSCMDILLINIFFML